MNLTDLQDTEIADLVRILQTTQAPVTIEEGARPLIVLNGQAVSVEQFLSAPVRKTGEPKFGRCESFTRYVNEHKTDDSRIYVLSNTSILAVLDHHGATAAWGQHRAYYNTTASLEWKAWTEKNKSWMTQKDFCEFIEDNGKDISSRADMLELVRTLQVNSTVDYNGWEAESDGRTALQYTKTVKARAGEKGAVELPPVFTITIAAFDGGDILPIDAKLRFEIGDDRKLRLKYELQQVQRILNEHTARVVATVAKDTGIEPFFGTP